MTQKIMIFENFCCLHVFYCAGNISYRGDKQALCGLVGWLCCVVFIIDLLAVLSVSGGLCWGLGAENAVDHY